MALYLDTASRSAGEKEEFCIALVPHSEPEAAHGALLAVADGLPGRPSPEAAARDVLKSLVDHYYAAPENWVLKHALQECFAAANRTLTANAESGRAASLSALVLRRRRWAIAHAGHTRIWLM